MKKLIFLLLLTSANVHGQMNCPNVISPPEFNKQYNAVLHVQGDKAKFNLCMDVLRGRCLMSNQIKQLAMLFNNDGFRLQFAMEAYGHTFDKPNFYEVYDAFKTFSAAFRLHDFVNGILPPPPPVYEPAPPPPLPIPVPQQQCYVTPSDFEQCKSTIQKEAFDNTKMVIAKQILAAKKCFSCVQIKELLNLFSFDSGKLELAKYAYDYCIDRENYYTIADAFSFSSSKEELMNYIKGK